VLGVPGFVPLSTNGKKNAEGDAAG
jgi:hypothetical protein